jgi:putative hemolysin
VISHLDDIDSILKLVGLFALFILAAFFSAAETLLSRLTRNDILNIAEAGGKRYEILASLLRDSRRYSATIIIAKSGLIVAIVVIFMSMVSVGPPGIRSVIGAILAAVAIVVITEFIPKNYVRGSSENSTIHALRFLRITYWILYFVIKPLTLLGYFGVRILGGKVQTEQDSIVSPEELETVVNVGDSQEILEAEEREMISRILDLPDIVAREIIIPRTDMVCLEVSTSEEEVLRTAIGSRHSRIPVYEETIDYIIGILNVKDMLDYWAEGKAIDLRALVTDRPPFFTPESKKISNLFRDLRANKQHMAIVVDEYGGTAGVVTLEDIIEEIVGEIQDEYDSDEQEECLPLGENVYSVDARMSIDNLNEQLGTQIQSENVDTVGGFVVDYFGKVPEQGDRFSYQGMEFTVLEADERRVHRIQIQTLNMTKGESNRTEIIGQ